MKIIRKRSFRYSLLFFVLIFLYVGCIKQDRVTVVFGTVKDQNKKPIPGVLIVASGERGVLGSVSQRLMFAATDVNGEYSMTVDVSKDYHSLHIYNKWFEDTNYAKKYKEEEILLNGSPLTDCCPAVIGEKNQFDYIMLFR